MSASRVTTGLLAALMLCYVMPMDARTVRGPRYLMQDSTAGNSTSSNAKGPAPNAAVTTGPLPATTTTLATAAVAARLSPNEQEQLSHRDTTHSSYANELIASGDRANSFCWFCAAAGAGDQAARGMWDLCQSMVQNERTWWLDRERRHAIDSGAVRPNKVAAAANLPPATTDVTTMAVANTKPAGNAKPKGPAYTAPAASPAVPRNDTKEAPKFQAASEDCQSVSEQFSAATDAMVADYLTQTVMGWDVGVETRRRATKAVLDVARAMQEMFDKLVEPHLPASPCGDAQPEDYWEEDAAGDAEQQAADASPAPADAAEVSPAPGNGTEPADGTPGRK